MSMKDLNYKPKPDNLGVGRNKRSLVLFLKKFNITITYFCDKIGISRSTIHRLENQEYVPSLVTALKIHIATRGMISMGDLLPKNHREDMKEFVNSDIYVKEGVKGYKL